MAGRASGRDGLALSEASGTFPEVSIGLQASNDLARAMRKRRVRIGQLAA